MTKETQLLLHELLYSEAFQEALNTASLHIGIPLDQFNELKAYLPEGTPFTLETINLALKNYRAAIIAETRQFIADLIEQENPRVKTTEK